jgi:hypothetical protein
MKKCLLTFVAIGCAVLSYGQLLLNEIYVRPNPQQGRQEYVELINTGGAPEDAACYSMVTYFKNEDNVTGVYVVSFPSTAVAPGGFLVGSSQAPTFQYQNGSATADFSWNDGHINRYVKTSGGLVLNNAGAPYNDIFVQSNGGGNGSNGIYAVFLYKGNTLVDAFLGSTPQTDYPSYITDLGVLTAPGANACGGLTYDFGNVNNENPSVYGHVTAEAGTDNGYYRKGISCSSNGTWDKASNPGEHTPGAPNPGNGSSAPSSPLAVDAACVNDTTISYDITAGSADAFPVQVTVYYDANGSQFLDAGDVPIGSYTETSVNAPARNVHHERGQEDFLIVLDAAGGCYDVTVPLNCPAAIILPVTLQSFNLSRSGNNISLRWTTLTEINNRGFYVQRLLGNGRWENMSFIPSQATGGNSTTALNYSFTDLNTFRGITQYRLQQVDVDGRAKYSDIRSTRGEAATTSISLYPNPSRGSANLQFAEANAVHDVVVTDMNGRVVKQWREVTTQNLVLSDLTPGIYTVRVLNQRTGDQSSERLVVGGR